jgi:hypothetical protein
MTPQEIFDAVDQALAEVSRRLASGELDGAGRFFTDEELAQGAAMGEIKKMKMKMITKEKKKKPEAAPAA